MEVRIFLHAPAVVYSMRVSKREMKRRGCSTDTGPVVGGCMVRGDVDAWVVLRMVPLTVSPAIRIWIHDEGL